MSVHMSTDFWRWSSANGQLAIQSHPFYSNWEFNSSFNCAFVLANTCKPIETALALGFSNRTHIPANPRVSVPCWNATGHAQGLGSEAGAVLQPAVPLLRPLLLYSRFHTCTYLRSFYSESTACSHMWMTSPHVGPPELISINTGVSGVDAN